MKAKIKTTWVSILAGNGALAIYTAKITWRSKRQRVLLAVIRRLVNEAVAKGDLPIRDMGVRTVVCGRSLDVDDVQFLGHARHCTVAIGNV